MGHLSRNLTLTVLLGVSLVLGTGLILRLLARDALTLPNRAPWPTAVATAPAANAGSPLRIVAIVATPARLAPLERATFATTFFNGGFRSGPYRATLQLLPRAGGPARSMTQSGFLLRHHQQLTLYWEWRVGASLPPGTYAMRVVLGEPAGATQPVTAMTAGRTLTIVPRCALHTTAQEDGFAGWRPCGITGRGTDGRRSRPVRAGRAGRS
jgi:hypothetical protein